MHSTGHPVLDAMTFVLAALLVLFAGPVVAPPTGTPWGGYRYGSGLLWVLTLIALIFHLLGQFS